MNLKKYLIVNEEKNPQTESSILSMVFRVKRHHVKEGVMTVTCLASIMSIYNRSRTVEMYVKTPEVSQGNTGKDLVSIFGKMGSRSDTSSGNNLSSLLAKGTFSCSSFLFRDLTLVAWLLPQAVIYAETLLLSSYH